MTRTAHQNKILFALFSKLRFDDDMRHDIAHIFSEGRTDRTSLLTVQEADSLIAHLQMRASQDDPENKMRKKILHYAHLMNWKTPDGKINMQHVNDWCVKYGKFHKRLNLHTYAELVQLLNQFEHVFQTYLNKV